MSYPLFCGFREQINGHIFAAEFTLVEIHFAVDEREQRVILTHTDIAARVGTGSALADNNIARDNSFTAEFFHAKTAACGIAAVT